MKVSATRWGAKWIQKGEREHLMFQDCMPVLFRTRDAARAWINENYGYIRNREDLRSAPHHWRVPKAIRVTISEAA